MSFNLVAYDKLKPSLQECVVTLSNKPKGISAERKSQTDFLLKTIKLLDNSEYAALEKSTILNAAAYYIYSEIYASYKFKSITSTLYNSLNTSLELDNENKPNREDLIILYSGLEKFLRANVHVDSDPTKGYLPIQPFNIKGFNVISHIKNLDTKINDWKIEELKEAEVKFKNHKENINAPRVHKSFLGSMFQNPPITSNEKNEEQKIKLGNKS